MDITELLTFGVANKASDLHISSGLPPMLRINGEIRKVNLPPLDANAVKVMVYDVMNDNLRKVFEQNMEVDFAFEIPNVSRFRANVFMQTRGVGAVFRSIPSKILSLTQLNAPAIFREITTYNKGMVLVTGPTGSGKSTTLAAMIDSINEIDYQHILTVEDPVEFIHVSKQIGRAHV